MRKEIDPKTVALIQKGNQIVQHLASASQLIADITSDGVIELGESYDAGRTLLEEVTGKK